MADIGSGHGRLALEIARRDPGAVVYATEVRPGPTAELRRLLGDGPVRLLEGSGLAPLRGLPCRGVVIAGMGGHTIAEILDAAPDVARELSWLCLQPMQDAGWLHRWLADQTGWRIDVAATEERSRVYSAFLVTPS